MYEIDNADRVVYLGADALTASWIRERCPQATSLRPFYGTGKLRQQAYTEMVDYVIGLLRDGLSVCFLSYGHPGVLGFPMHESIRRARSEGFAALMLPAISAEDCLFADLGVDPGRQGCHTYEATFFLLSVTSVHLAVPLVLWQIGLIGNMRTVEATSRAGLGVLQDVLIRWYGSRHAVVIYEASPYAIARPTITRVELSELHAADVSSMSTLYVPPLLEPERSADMMERLKLTDDVESTILWQEAYVRNQSVI